MLDVSIKHSFPGFSLDAEFSAPSGITVLYGRSGSGKTSVVNAVGGLLRPQEATIRIGSDSLNAPNTFVPAHHRRLGYIFQDARLFPHMTVKSNLTYGRRFVPKTDRPETLDNIVDLLGLGTVMDRRPDALSGGEKQRVAIGRALLSAPRMLLADEPLSSLDNERKSEVLPYFEMLRDSLNVPILYVTHSTAEMARLATTIVALENGRVTRQGPARELLRDPDFAPTGIRGVGALLDATVHAHHPDGLTELNANGCALFLPKVNRAIGQAIRVRIAAQDIVLATHKPEGLSALNIIEGQVSSIRQGDGPGAIVGMDTKAGRILARITQRSAKAMELNIGSNCFAVLKTVAIAPEDIGGIDKA